MKLLGLLATYLGVTAGLFGGLTAGVLWLVKADPAVMPAPRVAPVSPRIAESIERKMAATPVAPTPVVRTNEANVEVEPVKPVMKEADAALTPAPRRVQLRELNQRPNKRKPARDEHALAAHGAALASQVLSARAPIATIRTDFPY